MLRKNLIPILSVLTFGVACGPDLAPDVTAGFAALGTETVDPEPPKGEFRVIDAKDSVNVGKLPEGCVKLEGDDICLPDQTYYFGDNEVFIETWFENVDNDGECFKFYFDLLKAPALVSIKAGQDVFEGRVETADRWYWAHPDWVWGKGISNVVFCELEGDSDPCKSGGDVCGCPTDGKTTIDPCL